MEDTEFISNQVLPLNTPEMERFEAESATYEPLPSVPVHSNVTVKPDNKRFISYLTSIPSGHGGGICMEFLSTTALVIVEVRYKNVLVRNNTAVVGGKWMACWQGMNDLRVLGGMSIHMTNQFWNQDNRTTCFPSLIGFVTCQKFDIHNVTVIQNRAYLAGGIFSSLPDGVAVSCRPGGKKWTPRRRGGLDTIEDQLRQHCSNFSDNSLVDGSDNQAQAATRVVSLWVEGGHSRLEELVAGAPLTVPCSNADGAADGCPLRIAVKDAFNQTIRTGIDDASLDLTLISKAIVGDLRYTAVDGMAVINNTRAWGIDRNSTVKIVSERDRSIQVVLRISIRKCYPGEIDQRDVCNSCPVDQYSFVPALSRCQSCEGNAECRGGAALVPKDGYWHSTPFSPVFRECILLVACSYAGREEKLTLFYQDALELQEQLSKLDSYVLNEDQRPDFSEVYPQCALGYEGLLCGSCQSGYGHSYTGECESCRNEEATNSFFLFLTGLWLFVIVGINCGITMVSTETRVAFAKLEMQVASTYHNRQLSRPYHINTEELPRTEQTSHSGSAGCLPLSIL